MIKNNFNKNIDKNKTIASDHFQKRSGTSGLSGQLYETKLLSTILFRALNDVNVKEFTLGTNIEGVGAFDDIVLRYSTEVPQKTNLLFLQAKHKDDPNRDKLTVHDVLKCDGDFSFQKYLESYLKIKQKIISDGDNMMFQDGVENSNLEFAIYTSAKESFSKKILLKDSDANFLIKTSKDGKIFKFACEDQDLEVLVATVSRSRATLLAKSLSRYVLKNNFNNIMLDDLMKTYHVYLAKKVFEITVTATTSTAVFRPSFFTSSDEHLSLMRRVITKEISENKEVMSIYQKRFKVPMDFGNINFSFGGSEKKQLQRLEHMCSIFKKIFDNILDTKDSKHTIIKIDEGSIDSEMVLSKDLQKHWLGGLVGNLLEHDAKTGMLKFNLNEENLSKDNIKIIQELQKSYDLNKFRFDIDVLTFPKLALHCREHDIKLVKDFINKLNFYTNQAKEDIVEKELKNEIYKLFNIHQQPSSLNRIKSDAIFLKVHDNVQKWWKQLFMAPYLTKTCEFYKQAEREVLGSPLVDIVHSIYCGMVKNTPVEFAQEVINSLALDSFFNSNERFMVVISDELDWYSKKVIQYYNTMRESNDYIFIDLDYALIENFSHILRSELKCSEASTLIIINRQNTKSSKQTIDQLIELFKGKIITITNNKLKENELKDLFKCSTIHKDCPSTFGSLSSELRKIIFEERKILFQGLEVTVNDVFDAESLELFSINLLRDIIHNENIVLGKSLINRIYNETVKYYVNQSLCRYITLSDDYSQSNELFLIENGINVEVPIVQNKKDIVLIADSEEDFERICKLNNQANVHWFKKSDDEGRSNIVWKQTSGSIKTIIKFLNKDIHKEHTIAIQTLKDIQEKVVIITAEAGMGKSTLLTHLAANTKRRYPNLWILRINLLHNIDQFSQWNERNTNINIIAALKLLYTACDIYDGENSDSIYEKITKLVTINETDKISLKKHDSKYLPEIDLSEIKLFNHFYNNNSVAILFDGFDEVCPDYANEVIQLLCTLKKSRIAHLWITSRSYNVLHELELALETFSFTLNPLIELDQKLLLMQNLWLKNINPDDELFPTYCLYVKRFFPVITGMLNDSEGKFTSSPLHLHMIAEIYAEYFRVFCDFSMGIYRVGSPDGYSADVVNVSNLSLMYESFTDTKFFKIRFGEKKGSTSFKDPDMKRMVERERRVFVKNHKIIAAYVIFDKSIVLSEYDRIQVREFMQIIKSGDEKTGIIECIVGNNPKFVHFTFAEYFAVEFFFDKLRSDNCTPALWKYLIDNILMNSQNGIRMFINSKLQDESLITDLISNKDHMSTVYDLLLDQYNHFQALAILIAIENDFEFITLFLLQCIKSVTRTENLPTFIGFVIKKYKSMCLFCSAIVKRKLSIIQLIIEIVTDIDCSQLKSLFYCQDIPLYSSFLLALLDDRSGHYILNLLHRDPDLLLELFSQKYELASIQMTPAHFVAIKGNTMLFKNLSKLNIELLIKIYKLKDSTGKSPVHYAAKNDDYEFFAEMNNFLDHEEFKKICTSPDDYGLTPICWLTYDKKYLDKLKNVLQDVFERPIDDVKDFVHKQLPCMFPRNPSKYSLVPVTKTSS